MLIQKTMIGSTGSGSMPFIDTIEHEGALWLVPEWIEFQDEGVKKPLRIIRMTGLPHQAMPPTWPAHYLLNVPIPKELLARPKPTKIPKPFVVREAPDIEVPIQAGK